MGNAHGNQQRNFVHQVPPHEVWLQNQTFRIKGEMYTLRDRRGNGKFGSVWASTTPNGRNAAVKVFDLRHLRNDINPIALAKSFDDEIKMAYRMRGANNFVVNIYGFDFDSQRRVALMAMELGNDSLQDRVQNLHRMHPGTPMIGNDYISTGYRKNIWIQLVDIILALHRHNVIHRDIKPANLVFFGPILKVVDLGIAQKGVARYAGQQRLCGTPHYSAPECMTGEAPITSKADIWSAGAVLYYLTYGKEPVDETPKPPYGVPQTRSILVQDVLHHCLQRNLTRRANHDWLARHPLTNSNAIF